MMTCNHEELGARIDGEAHDPATTAAHLADCADCREDERLLRGLRDDVASIPTPPLPDDFNARMMAAIQPALARRTRWRDRFHAFVAFLLGGQRRLSLVEIGAGAFGVAAVGGAVGFLGLEMHVARIEDVPWLNASARALLDGMPQGHGDAVHAWGSTLLALLLAVGGLLCVRLIGLPPRGASAATTARACAGALGVYTALACAYLFTLSAMNLDFHGWIRLLQGGPLQWVLLVACGLSWWTVVRGRLADVPLLAGAFYACLLAAWGGQTAMSASLWWGDQLDSGLLTVEGVEPLRIFMWGIMPALGAALAGVAVAASSRPLSPALRGAAALLAVLAVGGVVVGSRPFTAQVFGPTDRARLDAELGLVEGPALPRTALLASSRGSVTVPLDGQWRLSADNLGRCRAWVTSHPSGLTTLVAKRLLALGAIQAWDDAQQWPLALDVLQSPGSAPWVFYQVQRALSLAPPTTTALAHLDAFAAMVEGGLPGRLDQTQRSARHHLAEAYDRLGAGAQAQTWVPGYHPARPQSVPVTMRDGVVEGRLLLDGRPLANVPVRLVSRRTGWVAVDEPSTEADIMKQLPQDLRFEVAGAASPSPNAMDLFIPLVATRTDATGRFRFEGLPDDTWCLAVLVDGHRPDLHALLSKPIRTSSSTRVVTLGDVRLEEGR